MYKKVLTEQNKKDILTLFYRTKLRKGETIINNGDQTIANELGLSYPNVRSFLIKHSKIKQDEYKYKTS